jgi:type II secretory ATPase GspE/PulE/Tfp pilus assembly ATPase PilB-like protein
MLAGLPEAGGYVSTFKIVSILVLLWPWLYAASWINKDVVRAHMLAWQWKGLALGSGFLALVIWFVLPWYVVGLVAYLALVGSTVAVYVVQRNRRVVAKARVLTRQHLSSLLRPQKRPSVEVVQRIKMYDALGRPVAAPPENQPQERQAYNFAQNFLHNVLVFRASEVDLSPAGEETSVRFVVDGVMQQRPAVARADAELVIDHIKGMAGMNTEERRRPQTGKIGVEAGAVVVDVDAATAGTTGGQRLQLRIVQEAARTNLEELGLPDDLRRRLEELNAAETGLILVAGPRANGVTSTLYSLLRRHDAFMEQLVTLEASAKVDVENITQYQYKDQSELAVQLAKTLRRDPDVVMVDACEATQAAKLICEAAGSKNVLLGCIADSSLVALAKWIKVVGEVSTAVAPLKAITCQVLVRKLCPTCREEYPPPRDLLAKLNLPAQRIDKFYRAPTGPRVDEKGRPVVCPTCRNTGYFGRTGAFELLEMTDAIRQLVIAQAPLKEIRAACRKNKMLYLQEQALRKVIEGVTSIDEVIRVSKNRS